VSTVQNIPTRIDDFVFGARKSSDEDAGNKDSQLSPAQTVCGPAMVEAHRTTVRRNRNERDGRAG
jgi:hypothetical protein